MAICPSAEPTLRMGRRWPRISLTALVAWACSAVSLCFFIGLAVFLILGGAPAFQRNGFGFLTAADWYFRARRFAAASILYGTCVVTVIAILVAAPLAIGSAIMTAEYLSGWARIVVKSLIELLAGIPSVVYGLLGVLFLRPFVFQLCQPFHPESGDTLLTAGVLVGIMILPTVMSLADDALRSVPREDREIAWALGLTRHETFLHAVLPKAFPGLICALLLGIGRALGETIAVYLVIGRADNRLPTPWYSLRPLLESGQTITSKLGGSEVYIAYGAPEHWAAMLGLGLVLFLAVMGCVVVGQGLLIFGRKYQA